MDELATALLNRSESTARALLHRDVAMLVDSGGIAPVADPLHGPGEVAAALRTLTTETSITAASINGTPGFVLARDGVVIGVVTAEMRRRLLTNIWVVCSPEKLRHWNRR
jgi:RNA polymerase sigma-70 factor (ECF subfamily)